MSTEQVVVQALGAISAGEPERFLAFLHDDVVYAISGNHPFSQKIRGKEAIGALMAQVGSAFEDGGPKYEVERLIVSGDSIVATFKGSGLLKNGKTYDNDYCMIFDFVDGRVARITEFFDSFHVMSVMAG